VKVWRAPRWGKLTPRRPGRYVSEPTMTTDSVMTGGQTFETLLAPVLSQAYGYALSLTRNQADAEDLLQDATFQAWKGFRTFQPGAPFKPWFFRVLTNCHRMTWRARARRVVTVSFGDAPDLFLYNTFKAADIPAGGDDPAARLISTMSREAVQAALRKLPEEYRVVASLYFIEDMSYEAIAAVLGLPPGTVRSRLHRARRLLQQRLWRVAEDEGIVSGVRAPVPKRGLDRAGCEVAFRRLDDYVDRELAEAEMKLVRDHLEVCALCSAEFAFEASVIRDVRVKLQRIDLPQDVRARVARRLSARTAQGS
jgi:RNA polymerase sigma-70 factor, ECF subfamily